MRTLLTKAAPSPSSEDARQILARSDKQSIARSVQLARCFGGGLDRPNSRGSQMAKGARKFISQGTW